MGCVTSIDTNHCVYKNLGGTQIEYDDTVSAGYGLRLPYEVAPLNADFGWRRLVDSSWEDPNDNEHCLPIQKKIKDIVFKKLQYPLGWDATFFNQQTRAFCFRNMAIMALNLAIRAKELAVGLGVSETYQSSCISECKGRQKSLETSYATVSSNCDITEALGMPDYGWKLLERSYVVKCKETSRLYKHQNKSSDGFRKAIGKSECRQIVLQQMTNLWGKKILVDCAAVGVNMCDQLNRLEQYNKGCEQECRLYDLENWEIKPTAAPSHKAFTAISPDQKGYSFVPEELIMNVSSWFQRTYLTCPMF